MAGTRSQRRGSTGPWWPARRTGSHQTARRARRSKVLGLQELEPRIAFAIAPALVADLNQVPNSSYPTLAGYGVELGATAAGRLFIADDLTHGRELWISDGSAAGTRLVKDINPGRDGTGLIAASPLFNGAFFGILNRQAGDPWSPSPTELWKTDGTAAGTVVLKSFADSYSYGDGFVVFGDRLYFQVEGQVWKTDGTEAGTVTVDGFGGAGTGNSSVTLFVLGTSLYGLASGFNGATLYRMTADNAVSQVVALPSVSIGSMYGPVESIVANNRFIFTAADGDAARSLWATDGTAAGTGPVAGGPMYPGNFALLGSAVYFTGENAALGSELWRTDGTPAGTSIVKDIATGDASSWPGSLTVAGGKLFFRATTAAVGTELWVSDGTTAGTKLVKDIASGSVGGVADSSDPSWLTPFAGKLFFSANGDQLWKSDGTAAGTVLVKDIQPDGLPTGSGGFGAMADFNGKLFFAADDGIAGAELWSSDGSTAGTKIVKDIAPGTGDGVPGGSASYLAGAALGNLFLFAGDAGDTGVELYKRDAAGTVSLVKDIAPSEGMGWNPASNPDGFATAGGAVYFGANETVFGQTFFNVWKTDGTAAGTVKVGTVGSKTNGRFGFTEFGGAVIFCADSPAGRGIYRTTGTSAVLVADGLDTESFTVFNGKLYFAGYTGSATNVYVMDSATSTPVRAAFDNDVNFSSPGWMAAVGNRLYIVGQSASGLFDGSGRLFVTDGTAAGTRPVASAGGEVPVIYGSGSLTPATSTLYFLAATSTTGQELYRIQTIGGVETAVVVKDIATGTDDAAISSLVFDGTRALFLVSGSFQTSADPVLWESDGTAAGTKPTTLIGAALPTVTLLAKPAGGRIYAAATDPAHGSELWTLPTVTAPGAPTGLIATPGAASVALAWTAPAANGGRAITDYVVQYRRASVATWSTFADAVSPTTAATVTGLVGGANYFFRVIARNDVGDGTPSAAIAATVPTPPGAPTGLTAVGGAGQAILTWTAPSSVGSSAITDYVVEFRRASVATWSVFADGVSTARTATVTGLVGGANYLFRVTARSAAGNGLPSATAVATILTPPSPPQWISATAGPGTATLAWTLPASQGTSPITDYVVQFRRLSSAVWSTFDDGVSTTRSATVTGLVRGANYAFRIIARSAAGDGAPSGQRSLTIG